MGVSTFGFGRDLSEGRDDPHLAHSRIGRSPEGRSCGVGVPHAAQSSGTQFSTADSGPGEWSEFSVGVEEELSTTDSHGLIGMVGELTLLLEPVFSMLEDGANG